MGDFYSEVRDKIGIFLNTSGVDLKKRGAVTGLVRFAYSEINHALNFISLLTLIEELNKDESIGSQLNYRGIQTALKKLSAKKGEDKKETAPPVKVESQKLQPTRKVKEQNQEQPKKEEYKLGDNDNPLFTDFPNLNDISRYLIIENDLTKEELESLNIIGIADTMTIFNKINAYCEKKSRNLKLAEKDKLFKRK